jgi:hypothetical protein
MLTHENAHLYEPVSPFDTPHCDFHWTDRLEDVGSAQAEFNVIAGPKLLQR